MAMVQVSADASSEPESSDCKWSNFAAVMRNDLSVRVRREVEEANNLVKQASLVSQKGGDLTPRGEDEPQNQLQFLLDELTIIDHQQTKLRDAVRYNKSIVIHPRQEVLQEDDDPDTPKAPTPKKIIVSGGLTGFGIAEDLLRIDFSTPEEAPEEYKAVAFFEEPDQIGHGISGSFGVCDPQSKEMFSFLEALEEQQHRILEMLSGRKMELAEKHGIKGVSQRESKPKRTKSRLGKGNRLAMTEVKQANADFLRIPRADTHSQPEKGLLNNKMPVSSNQIVASQTANATVANHAMVIAQPSALPPVVHKPRPVFQQPYKVAQVQKADEAKKVQQEIQSEFAMAMPGSTPSTQHLAKKKPTANTEEDSAAPYYSESPQAEPKPLASTVRMFKGLSMKESRSEGEKKDKSKGILRGFKKMLSKS